MARKKETEKQTREKPANGVRVSEQVLPPAVVHLPSAVPDELSVEQLVSRVEKVHEVQKRVMKDGIHYGVIPGCEKPTLLKAGAEILALTFKLDAEFEQEKEFDGEHLTVYSTCTLYHAPTGIRAGSGKSACSTKEEKYAYRHASRRCPECGNESVIKGRQEFGGGWLCWKKKNGCGFKFPDGDKRIESQPEGKVPNDRIPDCYNTVIKMADIRAHRAAILFTTAASDVFTQDMEETEPAVDNGSERPPPAQTAKPQSGNRPVRPAQDTDTLQDTQGQEQMPGHRYERTAAHNHLEQTVEDYCKANNIDPKVEGLTILERMSAYETREGHKHPGVRDVLLLSEKEAIICRCLIEDTIERNRNWRVELGQAIIKYCEGKKVTKEEVLEKCSGKRTIRDLDQPTAKKAFEKFQELYLRE